jgi:hypothetical protein
MANLQTSLLERRDKLLKPHPSPSGVRPNNHNAANSQHTRYLASRRSNPTSRQMLNHIKACGNVESIRFERQRECRPFHDAVPPAAGICQGLATRVHSDDLRNLATLCQSSKR